MHTVILYWTKNRNKNRRHETTLPLHACIWHSLEIPILLFHLYVIWSSLLLFRKFLITSMITPNPSILHQITKTPANIIWWDSTESTHDWPDRASIRYSGPIYWHAVPPSLSLIPATQKSTHPLPCPAMSRLLPKSGRVYHHCPSLTVHTPYTHHLICICICQCGLGALTRCGAVWCGICSLAPSQGLHAGK